MRVFIAVPVSGNFIRSVMAACEPLRRARPELRWVRPEGLHVTLAFLGELDDAGLASLLRAAREAMMAAAFHGIRSPFRLSATGLLTFPPHGKTTVMAADIGDGALEATVLANAMEDALVRVGLETGKPFRPREKRPFTPHLTLARANHPGIALTAAEKTLPVSAACLVEAVVVYRSVTCPGGARYEVIESLPLEKTRREVILPA